MAKANEGPQTSTGGGPPKQGNSSGPRPTVGRIVQCNVLVGGGAEPKIRPAIVTNVPAGQGDVIDATVFLVPSLDGEEHFAYAHNYKLDANLASHDTWRWPPRE